ncbi:hypothetical protein Misp01_47020 [Microtetraspora sp. NBRC 13810]|uniref:hypothetical protein n=1 Tax=Microtetraspora sp. NBRC 13810 TaxID=3030990 RepID=UPI0024A4C423|nr:hypothetical protein [Microtetraspora sp. NBRC 13810]GLW09573.1 hypothetical protein Misp01_47020 [Microtetraspora sp. NBRC 13810]
MTDGMWEELEIDPQQMRAGDIVSYLVKDYLAPLGAPLIHQGDWEVLQTDSLLGTHIGVDDDGRAYDVEAVSYHCRAVHSRREEWKLFTLDRKVTVRRPATGD